MHRKSPKSVDWRRRARGSLDRLVELGHWSCCLYYACNNGVLVDRPSKGGPWGKVQWSMEDLPQWPHKRRIFRTALPGIYLSINACAILA